MRMPLPIRTSDDVNTEEVKWPTVDFAHDMASEVVKGRKKKKRRKSKAEY